MEKQESAGAPLLIACPGFSTIPQPNQLRHTGSAGSQPALLAFCSGCQGKQKLCKTLIAPSLRGSNESRGATTPAKTNTVITFPLWLHCDVQLRGHEFRETQWKEPETFLAIDENLGYCFKVLALHMGTERNVSLIQLSVTH